MTMATLPTILVVDDDPSLRSSLAFSLELEGFRVETYHSAEALLHRDAPLPTGCLVLDHRLPGIDGLSLLTILRQRGALLPAIIITTAPPRSLRARIAQLGAALVEKPLLGDTLTTAILDALALARKAA